MKAEELRKQFAKDTNLEDEQSAIQLDEGVVWDYVTWLEEYAQSQLPKEGEDVYIECGKDAQTHYVHSTKTTTDLAWIPVRKTTLSLPTEEEVKKVMSSYWDMKHPEVNDFVDELYALLKEKN